MKKEKIPYQKTVFVCTHTRPKGDRVACGNPGRGGIELCDKIKNGVKQAGLNGKIRVSRSGCIDLCEKGPNAFVIPGDLWFSQISVQEADSIIKAIIE